MLCGVVRFAEGGSSGGNQDCGGSKMPEIGANIAMMATFLGAVLVYQVCNLCNMQLQWLPLLQQQRARQAQALWLIS